MQWLRNKLKKIFNKDMNFDMESLIAIKSHYSSCKLQWVKTNDKKKLGKIVEVVDIAPGRNGRFIALLSDKSQVDTETLSSDFYMIQDGDEPLSMAQVQSINYVPSLSEGVKVSPDIPVEIAQEIAKQPVTRERPAPTNQPQERRINLDHKPQVHQTVPQTGPGDLFGMFSLDETDLTLTVKVKMPNKNLLKMMYANSNDKDDFLLKLSTYINNNVTIDSIRESMEAQLNPQAKKKIKQHELQ